jgi:hypothetical protein
VGGRNKRERSEDNDGYQAATPAKRFTGQQKSAVLQPEGEKRKRGRPKGSKNKMSKAEKEAQMALTIPPRAQEVDHTPSMAEQPEGEDYISRHYAYPVHNDGFHPKGLKGTNFSGAIGDPNVRDDLEGMGHSSGQPSLGDANYSGLVDAIQQSLQEHDEHRMVR